MVRYKVWNGCNLIKTTHIPGLNFDSEQPGVIHQTTRPSGQPQPGNSTVSSQAQYTRPLGHQGSPSLAIRQWTARRNTPDHSAIRAAPAWQFDSEQPGAIHQTTRPSGQPQPGNSTVSSQAQYTRPLGHQGSPSLAIRQWAARRNTPDHSAIRAAPAWQFDSEQPGAIHQTSRPSGQPQPGNSTVNSQAQYTRPLGHQGSPSLAIRQWTARRNTPDNSAIGAAPVWQFDSEQSGAIHQTTRPSGQPQPGNSTVNSQAQYTRPLGHQGSPSLAIRQWTARRNTPDHSAIRAAPVWQFDSEQPGAIHQTTWPSGQPQFGNSTVNSQAQYTRPLGHQGSPSLAIRQWTVRRNTPDHWAIRAAPVWQFDSEQPGAIHQTTRPSGQPQPGNSTVNSQAQYTRPLGHQGSPSLAIRQWAVWRNTPDHWAIRAAPAWQFDSEQSGAIHQTTGPSGQPQFGNSTVSSQGQYTRPLGHQGSPSLAIRQWAARRNTPDHSAIRAAPVWQFDSEQPGAIHQTTRPSGQPQFGNSTVNSQAQYTRPLGQQGSPSLAIRQWTVRRNTPDHWAIRAAPVWQFDSEQPGAIHQTTRPSGQPQFGNSTVSSQAQYTRPLGHQGSPSLAIRQWAARRNTPDHWAIRAAPAWQFDSEQSGAIHQTTGPSGQPQFGNSTVSSQAQYTRPLGHQGSPSLAIRQWAARRNTPDHSAIRAAPAWQFDSEQPGAIHQTTRPSGQPQPGNSTVNSQPQYTRPLGHQGSPSLAIRQWTARRNTPDHSAIRAAPAWQFDSEQSGAIHQTTRPSGQPQPGNSTVNSQAQYTRPLGHQGSPSLAIRQWTVRRNTPDHWAIRAAPPWQFDSEQPGAIHQTTRPSGQPQFGNSTVSSQAQYTRPLGHQGSPSLAIRQWTARRNTPDHPAIRAAPAWQFDSEQSGAIHQTTGPSGQPQSGNSTVNSQAQYTRPLGHQGSPSLAIRQWTVRRSTPDHSAIRAAPAWQFDSEQSGAIHQTTRPSGQPQPGNSTVNSQAQYTRPLSHQGSPSLAIRQWAARRNTPDHSAIRAAPVWQFDSEQPGAIHQTTRPSGQPQPGNSTVSSQAQYTRPPGHQGSPSLAIRQWTVRRNTPDHWAIRAAPAWQFDSEQPGAIHQTTRPSGQPQFGNSTVNSQAQYTRPLGHQGSPSLAIRQWTARRNTPVHSAIRAAPAWQFDSEQSGAIHQTTGPSGQPRPGNSTVNSQAQYTRPLGNQGSPSLAIRQWTARRNTPDHSAIRAAPAWQFDSEQPGAIHQTTRPSGQPQSGNSTVNSQAQYTRPLGHQGSPSLAIRQWTARRNTPDHSAIRAAPVWQFDSEQPGAIHQTTRPSGQPQS